MELPQDLQNVVDQSLGQEPAAGPQPVGFNGPQGNLYDSGAPRVPASPVQPAPAIAPAIGENPGSLADKISKAFLEHLAQNQPQPVKPQPAQGSFASKLIAAGQGVMGSLGDAAHASDRPGGWLSGIENTLSARNQRLSAEGQRQFENQQQKMKDDALIARNQVETVGLVRNIYRQDKELRDSSYSQGKTFVDSLRDNHEVTDNITQDQLTDMVKKDPKYLQSHYVRPVGEEPVLDGNGVQKIGRDGSPVFSPTYSLVNRSPLHADWDGTKYRRDQSAVFQIAARTGFPLRHEVNHRSVHRAIW